MSVLNKNKNPFILCLQICLGAKLLEHFQTNNKYFPWYFSKIKENRNHHNYYFEIDEIDYDFGYDLFEIMRCCKDTKKIMVPKLIRIVEFHIFTIYDWNDDSKKFIKKINAKHLFFNNTTPLLYIANNIDILTNDISLNFLRICATFNQQIKPHILPKNLKSLIFGNSFNQPLLINVLPDGLKCLKFGECFNQPIFEHVLPESLIELSFSRTYNHTLQKSLFENLEILIVRNDIILTSLPVNLKQLRYISSFMNHPLKINFLPEFLTHLSIDFYKEHLIQGMLSDNLTHLILSYDFNFQIKENVLPKKLINLKFGNLYNQPLLPGVFPITLQFIEFGQDFNQPFTDPLSNPLSKNIFPKGLIHLSFGIDFNQQIYSNLLPESLTYLKFSNEFNKSLNRDILPKNLEKLILCKYYKLPSTDFFPQLNIKFNDLEIEEVD